MLRRTYIFHIDETNRICRLESQVCAAITKFGACHGRHHKKNVNQSTSHSRHSHASQLPTCMPYDLLHMRQNLRDLCALGHKMASVFLKPHWRGCGLALFQPKFPTGNSTGIHSTSKIYQQRLDSHNFPSSEYISNKVHKILTKVCRGSEFFPFLTEATLATNKFGEDISLYLQ